MTRFKSTVTTFLGGILALTLLIPAGVAMDSGIEMDAIDTVAGYGALLRLSNAPSENELEILVEKPDGSQVLLETESDLYGKAKIDVEGFYTKKAGEYTVMARTKNSKEDYGSAATFTVYPDSVSTSRSVLSVDRTTASANGNDYVSLEVYLRDRYNNPIQGHTINIISSRLTDEVVRISSAEYTNNQGSMLFHIYSRESGVATFMAHDTTSNITLNDRAKIAYYEPAATAPAIGGHTVILASSSVAGPVSKFEIEELEESVKVGQTLNFTVTAYDEDDNIATDYTGEIRFSSTDNNATLPQDYQFEAEDQGTHTFSLSLSFETEGTQMLTVTNIDDDEIYGEFEIEVVRQGTGSSSNSGSDSNSGNSGTETFTVLTPTAGTYSRDSLTFTGKATYGLSVQIYEEETKIGSTSVTADGTFSYVATGLQDGPHVYSVSTVDSTGKVEETSDDIAIEIDTSAPEVDQMEISPEGDIPAGSSFTVTLYTEKDLPEVSILFNNQLYDLVQDVLVDGVYQGVITAPEEVGEYEVDAILVDEVGNQGSYNAVSTLNVIEAIAEEITEEPETLPEVAEEEMDKSEAPGPVSGVQAVAGDGRVTLSWEAPQTPEEPAVESTDPATETDLPEEMTDEVNTIEEITLEEEIGEESTIDSTDVIIDHYRIYYGPDAELLYSSEDTLDNSTTWYVDGLDNNTLYYFKIVAVTADDIESAETSETISSTPKSAEAEALYAAALEDEEASLQEAAEQEALQSAIEEEDTPETGPEVLWLMAFSIGFGCFYFRRHSPRENTRAMRPVEALPQAAPIKIMDIVARLK